MSPNGIPEETKQKLHYEIHCHISIVKSKPPANSHIYNRCGQNPDLIYNQQHARLELHRRNKAQE